MKIGVIGTGMVGQSIAGKLLALGHDVVIGTRDVQKTLARSEGDAMGNAPFREWLAAHPGARLATLSEAAAHGELVVNATSGGGSVETLRRAGESNLEGKVLVDIANPLDFSHGMPPTLLVKDTDSLAEQIQRAFPRARVVKTLNTVNARVMVEPGAVGGGDHTMFVCGNEAAAKATVLELLKSFGWRDVIDLGDITCARATEMVLPIWLRLLLALKSPMFNFKVVR